MAKKVTIEIEARFTEKGLDGVVQKAKKAEKSVNNLKKSIDNAGKGTGASKPFDNMAQSASKAEKAIAKTKQQADRLARTKADIPITAKDKASAILNKLNGKLKTFAGGKPYNVYLGAKDKASSVLDKIQKKLAMLRLNQYLFNVIAKDKASNVLNKLTSKLKTVAGGKPYNVYLNAKDKATNVLNKLKNSLKGIGNKSHNILINAKDRASNIISKISGNLKNITGPLRSISGMFSSITNKLFSIKTLIAGIMGGMAVNKFALQPIALADQMENSLIGFTTLLGSGTKAAEMIADIKDFARTTPLDTSGTISSVQQMLNAGIGSAEKYNADGTENSNYVMKMIEKIGNAASASGGGTEAMKGITLALSQMSMTGKVNAQDMMQLANRNIPAWRMLADYFKTSVQEVREMSRDGAITAEQGIAAIMQGMEKYDGMMRMLSTRTASGIWSNIKDTFQLSIVEKWGRGLQSGAIKGLSDFAGWLDRISPLLDRAGASLEKIGEYISSNLFDGFENAYSKVEEILRSDDFIHADGIGSKMKVLFGELWHSFTGWLTAKAPDIGKFMGNALSNGIIGIADFITGALGGNTSELDSAASNMGASFWEAFCSAFEGKKVLAALGRAVKSIFSSAGKILPGGEKAGLGSWLSAYMIGMPLLKSGALLESAKLAGKGIYQGGKKLLGGAWLGKTTLTEGVDGAVTIGGNGIKALGAKFAAKLGYSGSAGAMTAAGLGSMAGIATTGATLVSAFGDYSDAMKHFKSVNSTDRGRYNEIQGYKEANSGSAKVLGAGIGAAIGTIILPGVGTAIGAGIGSLAGWIAGEKGSEYHAKKDLKKLNDERWEQGKLSASDGAFEFADKYGIDWENATFKSVEMRKAIKDTTLSAEELGKTFDKAVSKDLARRFGDVSLSLEDIDEMARRLVYNDNIEDVDNYTAAIMEAEQALTSFGQAKYSVDKWNIKTDVGLNINDKDQYMADVGSLTKYASDYLENKQLEFNAGVKLLFGDLTTGDGKTIAETGTAYHNQLIKEIEGLELEIDKQIELAGDVIDINEAEAIRKLTDDVNAIIQKVSEAENTATLELLKLQFGNSEMTADNFTALQTKISEYMQESADTHGKAYTTTTVPLEVQLADPSTDPSLISSIKDQIANAKTVYIEGVRADWIKIKDFTFDVLDDKYVGELGNTAAEVAVGLNKAIDYAVRNNIQPIDMSDMMFNSIFGMKNIDQEVLSEMRTMLQTLFNSHIDPIDVDVPTDIKPEVITDPVKVDVPTEANIEPITIPTAEEWNETFVMPESITSPALTVNVPVKPKSTTDWSTFDPLNNFGLIPKTITGLTTTADVAVTNIFTQNPEKPTVGPFNDLTTTGSATVYMTYKTVGKPTLPSLGSFGVLNNANGGIASGKNGAQLSWLTEEGYDESIIPLNPARRGRALDLWTETGRRLGVLNNAEGGIVEGTNPYEPSSSDVNISSNNSGGGVSVSMEKGSVSINITADSSQTVSEAIENQKEAIAEQVAAIIAKVVGSQFANRPTRA